MTRRWGYWQPIRIAGASLYGQAHVLSAGIERRHIQPLQAEHETQATYALLLDVSVVAPGRRRASLCTGIRYLAETSR